MNSENSLLQEKINKGIKYFEDNKLTEAIEIFEDLKLNKNTKNIGLLFLGIISIKNKDNSKAKKHFKKMFFYSMLFHIKLKCDRINLLFAYNVFIE